MSENTGNIRLSKVVKEIGVGIATIVDHLSKKGFKVDSNPNSKITDEQYNILLNDFQSDKKTKDEASLLSKAKVVKKEEVVINPQKPKTVIFDDEDEDDGILIKSGLSKERPKVDAPKEDTLKEETQKIDPPKAEKIEFEEKKEEFKPVLPVQPEKPATELKTEQEGDKLKLTVVGKIDLDAFKKGKGKKTSKKEETPTPTIEEQKSVKVDKKTENPKLEEIIVEKTEEIILPVVETVQETIVVEPEQEVIESESPKVMDPNYEKLSGLKVMGKIVLPVEQPKKPTPIASSDGSAANKKKRRRNNFVAGSDNVDSKKFEFNPNRPQRDGSRPITGTGTPPPQGTNPASGNRFGNNTRPNPSGPPRPYVPNPNYKGKNDRNAPAEEKTEITEKQIQDKLKETLARLNPGSKPQNIGAVRSKIRKQKRDAAADKRDEEALELEGQRKIKVTEFVTANELSQLMDVQITNIISACM